MNKTIKFQLLWIEEMSNMEERDLMQHFMTKNGFIFQQDEFTLQMILPEIAEKSHG